MNTKAPLIGIHIEHGVVQRVTSDDGSVIDATVVVIDHGTPTRALLVGEDDGALEEHAQVAADATRCDGIGIACDLAGEQLIRLGRTHFETPKEFVAEVANILNQLSGMISASIRLDPGAAG
jgi:hypothetical protein